MKTEKIIKLMRNFYEHDILIGGFDASDKEWLMKYAEEGLVPFICVLLEGMREKCRVYYENFIDEDTQEKDVIPRYEWLDGTTFEATPEEIEHLEQLLLNKIKKMTYRELYRVKSVTEDNTPYCLELIERWGEDSEASNIKDPKLLLDLLEKGNKYAASELYQKYRWGDEEHGIFINRKKAREYYDMAGDALRPDEEWEEEENPGEPCPRSWCYTLKGNPSTVSAVVTLVNELCNKWGTPDNELGLYVPQEIMIKSLVGSYSKYYQGNIISMEQEVPDQLLLYTEADRKEPLKYALLKAFPDLEVEVKESEWTDDE